MDELAKRIQEAHGHVRPAWDEERSERAFRSLQNRRRRRTVLTTVAIGLAAAVALVLALPSLFGPQQTETPPLAEAAVQLDTTPTGAPVEAVTPDDPAGSSLQSQPRSLIALADGSAVSAVTEDAQITALSTQTDHVELRLEQGRARFDVVPNPERAFVVRTAGFTVSVLGTVFEVERRGADIEVRVERGLVRVERAGMVPVELPAGDQRAFAGVAATGTPPSPAKTGPRAVAKANPNPTPGAAPENWRTFADREDYARAYELLRVQGPNARNPADLMLAADTARLAGHPGAAADYLHTASIRHPESPLAPMASFTEGRIRLDRLGQARKAVRAFRRCRTLAPDGPLAQDALAREVEALSRAGDQQHAAERARAYLDTYPKGRRVRAVRMHGGIE